MTVVSGPGDVATARIAGVDIARGIAILGMFVAHTMPRQDDGRAPRRRPVIAALRDARRSLARAAVRRGGAADGQEAFRHPERGRRARALRLPARRAPLHPRQRDRDHPRLLRRHVPSDAAAAVRAPGVAGGDGGHSPRLRTAARRTRRSGGAPGELGRRSPPGLPPHRLVPGARLAARAPRRPSRSPLRFAADTHPGLDGRRRHGRRGGRLRRGGDAARGHSRGPLRDDRRDPRLGRNGHRRDRRAPPAHDGRAGSFRPGSYSGRSAQRGHSPSPSTRRRLSCWRWWPTRGTPAAPTTRAGRFSSGWRPRHSSGRVSGGTFSAGDRWSDC